ncbi:glycosyl hydrolase family 18 protein [[Clostridium] aminophilum]|uniref:Spore germination protein YaaH n=1 Tax=[Clostridium] aminophilum TaxID=1526 RepID=A0A1I6KIZ9_9FIRM|nr:glycosyl hydrolase family 18 protein [[Clostridium] aminophilum]SFR91213.1 Spore germination protein YaaH [[Clostridium] aminophilum]
MGRRLMSCLSFLLLLGLIVLAAAGGVYAYLRYMPSNKRADLSGIYTPKTGDGVILYLNYDRQETEGRIIGDKVYLPIDFVNDNLNERFYYDREEKALLYTLPEEILRMTAESKNDDGSAVYVEDGDSILVSAEIVSMHTAMAMTDFSDTEYPRLYIQNSGNTTTGANLREDTEVRIRGGIKAEIVEDAKKGDHVTVLDSMENWSKIVTAKGFTGYVKTRSLTDFCDEEPDTGFTEPEYKTTMLKDKITMIWHQTTSQAANAQLTNSLTGTKGVNVIAPTWFGMKNNSGEYESIASADYVKTAHSLGMKVWPVLDNFGHDYSSNVNTEKLLSKTSVRTKLIKNLMKEAATYGFDGYNLDFEGLKKEAGVHYTQFIREMSVACRKAGLTLSVDDYPAESYNHFYNYQEQGVWADYVILMAYDEHYAGGEAGSVSSLSYVVDGIDNLLSMVPKEKIIAGLPFYTRLWTVSGENTSSQALHMSEANEWVKNHDLDTVWDEETGQNYAELEENGKKSMIWLEDADSMKKKVQAVKAADVAGMAGWKLGMETSDIWNIFGWKN